jgi:hypothetical protein
MPKSRPSVLKRQRELAKKEQREAKRQRRIARKEAPLGAHVAEAEEPITEPEVGLG